MFKTNSTLLDDWGKKKGRFQTRVLIPPWIWIISVLFINPNAWAASINFGPTPLGSSSLQVVNISNSLPSPLSLGTIGLVSDEFKIQSDGCANQTLAIPASCEVNVLFTPQTVGAKTAQLTVPGVNSTTSQRYTASVFYQVHVADKGWLDSVRDGNIAGTTGEGRQIEAIIIRKTGLPSSCLLKYNVHAANVGWMGWTSEGDI